MLPRERRSVVLNTGPGLTEQSHKEECDINYILRDYSRTGFLKHAKKNEGRYDDVTSQDFQEAMFTVTNAQSLFNDLPALVRKRFGNSPSAFFDFVHDPGNLSEMQRLGIAIGVDGIDLQGNAIANASVVDEPVSSAPE